jgi:hypothetical protein
MVRIAPSQPSVAMARIASRRNRTISLDPNLPGQNSERDSLDVDTNFFSNVQIDSKRRVPRIGLFRGKIPPLTTTSQIAQFYVQPSSIFSYPPCSAASFSSKLRAPHRGTSLVPLVCGAKYGRLEIFIRHDSAEIWALAFVSYGFVLVRVRVHTPRFC